MSDLYLESATYTVLDKNGVTIASLQCDDVASARYLASVIADSVKMLRPDGKAVDLSPRYIVYKTTVDNDAGYTYENLVDAITYAESDLWLYAERQYFIDVAEFDTHYHIDNWTSHKHVYTIKRDENGDPIWLDRDLGLMDFTRESVYAPLEDSIEWQKWQSEGINHKIEQWAQNRVRTTRHIIRKDILTVELEALGKIPALTNVSNSLAESSVNGCFIRNANGDMYPCRSITVL